MTICPSCNGPHLDGLRFQHKSICDFYMTETQTQAADHARFRANRGRPITRDATPTEMLLLAALGEDAPDSPDAEKIRVTFHGAIWHRTIPTEQNKENHDV